MIKKYILILLLILLINNCFSQIYNKDSLPQNLKNLVLKIEEIQGIIFSKYKSKNCFNMLTTGFKKNNINLSKQVKNVYLLIFDLQGTAHVLQIYIYEYESSLIVENLYNKIKLFYTNSREFDADFKMGYIFRYKNYLCNNYSCPRKLSSKVKELTGEHILWYPYVNKYENKSDQRYWNSLLEQE